MKYDFKVKTIDVTAGGKNTVVLFKDDAADIDVSEMDRVKITTDGKEAIALVQLTHTYVKEGQIASFAELTKKLSLKTGQTVRIEPVDKPASVAFIKKKLDGGELSENEISEIITGLMKDELSEVELTAFIVGSYIRGLNYPETISLTKNILASGTTLNIKRKPIMDKHCIGGVPGNKTSMIIVPIVAAAGLTIPKTSSRSITSPAGTADCMEVLAPVTLDEKEIEKVVLKTNGCIVWGGGVNLAAADDKLIKIRNPLKLDPRGMLLASILAKKKAVGATHVLIDIPVGVGTKMAGHHDAELLARDFMDLGTKLDMEVHCILTPGYDPIGFAVGPAIEAREVLKILSGENVSADLIEKGVVMSGLLLEMGGKAKEGEGKALAETILSSGKALEKFREIIGAQGGNAKVKPDDIHIAPKKMDVVATDTGRVHLIEIGVINSIARLAGAPKDPSAGLYMYAEKGDKILKGQKLMTIYAESDRKLDAARELFEKSAPFEMDKMILGEYSTEQKPYVYEYGKQ
ncbi:AMP phosphorylase [Candidatus Micrarchaeota archaeon]|nr:AMP phosphorylase [Candidatus Micrarchaeota archaeon]